MTGDVKPGDALADRARDEFDKNRRERELAIERLRIRAEMRSEHGEEEDTGVIHLRAQERVAARVKSDPPSDRGKQAIALVSAVRGWPQAVVAVALLGLLALIAYLKLR
jgi:Mrp family chromosome partitioning ATPase